MATQRAQRYTPLGTRWLGSIPPRMTHTTRDHERTRIADGSKSPFGLSDALQAMLLYCTLLHQPIARYTDAYLFNQPTTNVTLTQNTAQQTPQHT